MFLRLKSCDDSNLSASSKRLSFSLSFFSAELTKTSTSITNSIIYCCVNHQEKKSYEKRNIEIEFVEERESQNLSDDFKHLVEVVPGDVAVVLRHLHRRVPGYLLRDCVGEPALPQPGVEVVPPAMEAYASGILHCFRYPHPFQSGAQVVQDARPAQRLVGVSDREHELVILSVLRIEPSGELVWNRDLA